MNKVRKTWFIIFLSLTILLDAFIIIESCIAGAGSSMQSQSFTKAIIDFVEKINPSSQIGSNPEQVHAVLRKVFGHFLLFGLSGIFTFLSLEMINIEGKLTNLKVIIIGVSTGLFLSILTELIQYFVPGRAGMLTDTLIDLFGFIFFGSIIYIIFLIYNKKKLQNKRA